MPFAHPVFEYGRDAVRLRPLPVVLLAIVGNVAALLGPLVVAILSVAFLAWFVLSELSGKHADETKDEKRDERVATLVRDAIRQENITDSRSRAIVETIKLGDELNVFLQQADVRTRTKLVGMDGEPDAELRAVIEAENAETVRSFNRDFYDNLRQVWSDALGSLPSGGFVTYSIGFGAVLTRGASCVADIHETYAALDDAARQIIHGSY